MVFAADPSGSLPLQQVLHSAAQHPAMYNNNYLPNLNQFGPAPQLPVSTGVALTAQPPDVNPGPPPQAGLPFQPHVNQPPMSQLQGNFRFLAPTQGTAVPTWVPPSSSMGMATAPGVGASWQHSVPSIMPWAHPTPPNFNAEASPSVSVPSQGQQPFPLSASDRFPPSVPFSASPLGRKRHSHDDDVPEGPSSKKYLSERMATWFKQLQITPAQQSSGEGLWNTGQDNGWRRFCEVERRLQVEEAEIEEADTSVKDKDGEPRLVFAEGIDEESLTAPDPVLPEAIMNRITSNPCMELVLYKEPEILPAVSASDNNDKNNSSIISLMTPNGVTANEESSSSTLTNGQQQDVDMSGVSASSLPLLDPKNGMIPSSQTLSRNISDADMFDSVDDDMDL